MEKVKDPLWSPERSRVLTKIWSLGSWMRPRIPEKDQMPVSTFSFGFGQRAAISYSGSRLGHRKVLCKSLSLNLLGICCQYQRSPVRNPTMHLWSWISVSFPVHPVSHWERCLWKFSSSVHAMLFQSGIVGNKSFFFFFFKDWIAIFPHPKGPALPGIPKDVGVGGWYISDNWLIRCLFLNQMRIMVSGKPSGVGEILALWSSFPRARSDGATRVSHSQEEDNTQPFVWEQDAFTMKSSFTSAADLISSQSCIF